MAKGPRLLCAEEASAPCRLSCCRITHIDVRYLMSSFSASSSQVRPLCSFQSPWHFLQVSWGQKTDTKTVPGKRVSLKPVRKCLSNVLLWGSESEWAKLFLKTEQQQKLRRHRPVFSFPLEESLSPTDLKCWRAPWNSTVDRVKTCETLWAVWGLVY